MEVVDRLGFVEKAFKEKNQKIEAGEF